MEGLGVISARGYTEWKLHSMCRSQRDMVWLGVPAIDGQVRPHLLLGDSFRSKMQQCQCGASTSCWLLLLPVVHDEKYASAARLVGSRLMLGGVLI